MMLIELIKKLSNARVLHTAILVSIFFVTVNASEKQRNALVLNAIKQGDYQKVHAYCQGHAISPSLVKEASTWLVDFMSDNDWHPRHKIMWCQRSDDYKKIVSLLMREMVLDTSLCKLFGGCIHHFVEKSAAHSNVWLCKHIVTEGQVYLQQGCCHENAPWSNHFFAQRSLANAIANKCTPLIDLFILAGVEINYVFLSNAFFTYRWHGAPVLNEIKMPESLLIKKLIQDPTLISSTKVIKDLMKRWGKSYLRLLEPGVSTKLKSLYLRKVLVSDHEVAAKAALIASKYIQRLNSYCVNQWFDVVIKTQDSL